MPVRVYSLWVTLRPPAVSCTLLNSSSDHTSSLILRPFSSLFSPPILLLSFSSSGTPARVLCLCWVLCMKLLVFVRLSEVEGRWKRERDNLVDYDGCFCRGGRDFSGQNLHSLHYVFITQTSTWGRVNYTQTSTDYTLYITAELWQGFGMSSVFLLV